MSRLFQKLRVNVKNGRASIKYVLGVPLISSIKNGSYSDNPDNRNPVFYLKVNRSDHYVFLCLQHWINIIDILDADFYIICDNNELKKQILRRIVFKNGNIKFVRSARKALRNIVKNIADEYWTNAAYAHLTAFLHAKQNHIENFWNIDADDIMLLAEPSVAAKIILEAQNYADKNDINAFSLDIHRSQERKRYWTFGVTYIKMQSMDYFKMFENNQDTSWEDHLVRKYDACNVDSFFTFKANNQQLKAETFYIENCSFIHFGNILVHVAVSGMFFWKDGKFFDRILSEIYRDEKLGIMPIADDCVKFDLNIKEDDCLEFAKQYVTNIQKWSERCEFFETCNNRPFL